VQNEPKDTKLPAVKARRKSHRIGPSRRLGKAIKLLRSSRGLSQEELADLAKLDRTFISMLERGIRRATLETAQALARALDMTLAELIAKIG
jgi:transcriptional regulator with XRE-family HTH domain